jgi:cysteinyl-tRNA synthetase
MTHDSKNLQFYNTLTRQKEVFEPLKPGQAGLYHCGPTVYDYAHIGNLRAYVFADVLRRALENNGFAVKQVVNITDIGHLISDADEGEDKMTKALRRESKELTLENMLAVGTFYMQAFLNDLDALNIKRPHVLPRASEHIPEQIKLISRLDEKGFVYKTSDGLYFNISKFPRYADFARLNMEREQAGARVEVNKEKKHPADFALWKFNAELGWETPWGKGFPGWHIECSAMSMAHLGEQLDIHTGGIDHIPVHHTNEIAQSEAATGQQFAKYWMHSEFLNMAENKMAKSEGNVIRLQTLAERGFSPLAYRYLLLTAHYRSPLIFSWEALAGAQTALTKLIRLFTNCMKSDFMHVGRRTSNIGSEYKKMFEQLIADDLDTPKALALVWDMVKDNRLDDEEKGGLLLDFDRVLGLGFTDGRSEELTALAKGDEIAVTDLPENIQKMVNEREVARESKDFEKADALRKELALAGYSTEDREGGPAVRQISTDTKK